MGAEHSGNGFVQSIISHLSERNINLYRVFGKKLPQDDFYMLRLQYLLFVMRESLDFFAWLNYRLMSLIRVSIEISIN